MKKNTRITIMILLGVLAAAALIYFTWMSDDTKRYSWYESYKPDSDQPYGTRFIRQMLESYHPGGKFILSDKKPLKDVLPSAYSSAEDLTYVFIGQSVYLDDSDLEELGSFLEQGGEAFISSLDPPDRILSSFYTDPCDDENLTFDYRSKEFVTANFYHDSLRSTSGFTYTFRMGSSDRKYAWNFIDATAFCDSASAIAALGYHDDDLANFVRIDVGKGHLYLHTAPLFFTNYFLTQSDKVEYASGVFSHFRGKDILWDEFSKVPFLGNNNAYDSPLYYILQQPSLKYAWWLLLLTVLLYILFFVKRQQRIIPVLEAKSNTSLEFVQLVSSLHYQNGNHLDMARKKMKYFLYFVRSKYGIHADTFGPEHIRKLAEKSGVPLNDVQMIFDQYYLIERKFNLAIEANRLLDLYSAIERFYRQCK